MLSGKALTRPGIILEFFGKAIFKSIYRLSDAYRFCESRKMTLFQPDTKAKNLFLSKLSILVDKPILFDLYRFGTNFEFKYGQVLINKMHLRIPPSQNMYPFEQR